MIALKHTPGPWIQQGTTIKYRLDSGLAETIANVLGGQFGVSNDVAHANARLIAAAPKLLAYAECEEAKHRSLLPTDKGGTGNCQSYMDVFNQHGWDGRDVYGFLDRLRRESIAEATGRAA
jgi:hypothetical protein